MRSAITRSSYAGLVTLAAVLLGISPVAAQENGGASIAAPPPSVNDQALRTAVPRLIQFSGVVNPQISQITPTDQAGPLNRDFRYQLTCIGGFAPVYVAEEISGNQFKIAGGKPGMKVSWQVTGSRQDAWANAHRIPVDEEKNARERGYYLHPELYGAPPEKSIEWARHPQLMKRRQEMQEKAKQRDTAAPL